MTGPAVRFQSFREGAELTTITPGSGAASDQFALVPLQEPGSAGLPPYTPTLVASVAVLTATRRVRDAAGYAATAPLDTAQRTAWTVAWSGLTLA